MREDMAKVIVERPRRGGVGKMGRAMAEVCDWRRIVAGGREDEARSGEGIAARHRNRRKWFDENLAPLRRFLRGAVGRRWDEVHAELCERLTWRSTVQRHVLHHVEHDLVALRARRDDEGAVVQADGRALRRQELAVVDGLLVAAPSRRRRRHAPPDRPTFTPERPYVASGGGWFELTLAPIPSAELVWDALRRCTTGRPRERWRRSDRHWTEGGTLYVVKKRQLSRVEVKALGLRPPPAS